jgi:hypothetical protein
MRVTTAVLIVLAGVTVGHAQQLERPPFYPPPKEKSLRPLFPTPSPDLPLPSLAAPRAEPFANPQPGTPQRVTPQPLTPQRSGSVCLKTVPVDPSFDRAFVLPIPDTRGLPLRIIEMPPCVTLAPQQTR